MRQFLKFFMIPVLAVFLLANAYAEENMGHGSMAGGTHEAKAGKKIRETMIDGHHLTYRLIDMKERMKDMPEMDATHHLMVFIKAPDGSSTAAAKVGYLVEGPDGSTQKAMAMAMSGGFGADLDLTEKGTYTVKTKAVAGEAKLIDAFSYTVE